MAAEREIELGTVVLQSYNAGFIVLSYLISLAGCVTCLELLHRRTSRLGLYNWYVIASPFLPCEAHRLNQTDQYT